MSLGEKYSPENAVFSSLFYAWLVTVSSPVLPNNPQSNSPCMLDHLEELIPQEDLEEGFLML